MTEATPRPWAYSGDDDGDFIIWGIGAKGNVSPFIANVGDVMQQVSDCPETLVGFDANKANAALIVRAVNAHDALVAALEPFAEVCGWIERARELDRTISFPDWLHATGTGATSAWPIKESDFNAAHAALALARGNAA